MKNNKNTKINIGQHDELEQATSKISEIESNLTSLSTNSDNQIDRLDEMISFVDSFDVNTLNNMDKVDLELSLNEYNETYNATKNNINFSIKKLDNINSNGNDTIDDLLKKHELRAKKNGLDLNKNPYFSMMSLVELKEFDKRIEDNFLRKKLQIDKEEYLLAGTVGIFSGIIDVCFCSEPGKELGSETDKIVDNAVKVFAKLNRYKGDKIDGAIKYLENKFKVNYDQQTGSRVNDLFKMNTTNHHLLSLPHSPDPLGLIVSIINQFTNTSTFIANGKIITVVSDSKNFELQGGNFVAKIFCGCINWFGHCVSDVAGSSGAEGRGSGLPIPFYNLLQLANFGSIDKKTIAKVAEEVFKAGYDFRHGITMAIPVLISELLTRFFYAMYQILAKKKKIEELNIFSKSNHELERLLLVSCGTLAAIDIADGVIRGGGGVVDSLTKMNIISFGRVSYLGWHEICRATKKFNDEAIEKYFEEEYSFIMY